MPLTTLLGLVHLVAGLAALLAVAALVRVRRDPARVVVGRGWLLVALGAASVWAGHLAWWCLAGPSPAQLLWLPSVGAAMGALLAWSVAVLRPGRLSPLRSAGLVLVDPALLLAAQLALGPDVVATRYVDRVDYGWFYGVHVVVTFTMMLATASLWFGHRSDPSRVLRAVGRVVVLGLVAAGVAQALQVMVLDVAVCALGAAVVVIVLRSDAAALVPRPQPEVLLDGLGALVLVFDRDDRLVDLNAPARSFFAGRDGAVPGAGTRAADLIPVRVDEALGGIEVRLSGPGEPIDFSCFSARLGPSTSPPGGGVVVLRRAAVPEPPRPDVDHLARLARRCDQLSGALGPTEPVVVLGLGFTCGPDAERAAQAIEFVVGSLDSLVVERVGGSALVAVAPTRAEPYLLDVADGWRVRPDVEAVEAVDEGPLRSVSLSPVLDRGRVVRHATASQAAVVGAEVARDLVALA